MPLILNPAFCIWMRNMELGLPGYLGVGNIGVSERKIPIFGASVCS